jgi:hypothetical protein
MDKKVFMMPFNVLILVISHYISLIPFTQLLAFKGAVHQVTCNDWYVHWLHDLVYLLKPTSYAMHQQV